MRAFLILWVGQLLSNVGTQLTSFALGIWVLQNTSSVTQFGLVMFFATIPGILLSPVAGVFVDRHSRRNVMIFSDTLAGIGTMIIFALLTMDLLNIWHVVAVSMIGSIAGAFQMPAYSASVTLLVDKKDYARAGGLTSLSQALATFVGPPLAGFLIGLIALNGIILVDLTTFGIAVISLMLIRVPDHRTQADFEPKKTTIYSEAREGWAFVKARPGLLLLLSSFFVTNFMTGLMMVISQPYVLAFSTPTVLGMLLSTGALGTMAASALIGATGGPKRQVLGVYLAQMGICAAIMVSGFAMNIYLVGAASFSVFFCLPYLQACSGAIWQRKVDVPLQGRVFAIRRLLAWFSAPIAYLVAGPIADHLFEPSMSQGVGLIADVLGPVIGIREGKGYGAMFIVGGILSMILITVIFRMPRLRLLDEELPDVKTSV